jgi:excisionase family DNA binding protein
MPAPQPSRYRDPTGGLAPMRQSPTGLEVLLTVNQVADLLQIQPSTVRAYAERGVLACVRVGNRLRFAPSDLSLWIEQRRMKGGRPCRSSHEG